MLKNMRVRINELKSSISSGLASQDWMSPWMIWLCSLAVVILIAFLSGVVVFWQGLWITNLTDLVPWGLWITIDLSAIALAAGAFSLCAAVYLIGLKRYQPIARTATFIGMIGYTMAMLALLLDIGRPDRFWHSVVYWNVHSLLWEVTMAIVIYSTVLFLECLPILASLEWLRRRYPKLTARMTQVHQYAPYLAIAGLALSSLHQSSLGAVYGVLKSRPFWYKPELAVLFMISAIIGGIALTLFASMLAARLTPKAKINDALIERLSHFIGWALAAYFYFRFWDWLAMTYTHQPGRSEGLELMTKGTLSFNFWMVEMFFGMLVPMVILLNRRTRMIRFWRMLALALVVIGVIAYRWDTNLAGLLVVLSYLPGEQIVAYTTYRPSFIEWSAGLGIIAYGLLAFSLGVKYLRVVDHRLAEAESELMKVKARETVTA